MQRVDLFKADKAMAERVLECANARIWTAIIIERRRAELKELNTKRADKEKSLMSQPDGSSLAFSLIAEINEIDGKIDAINKEVANELEINRANFEWTEVDTQLYKDYKKATTKAQVYESIAKWFDNYHIEVRNTTLMIDIMDNLSGKRKAKNRTIIKSDGKKFLEDKRTKTDFLDTFYGSLCEECINAGTIKTVSIPDDVKDLFAKKSKKSDK